MTAPPLSRVQQRIVVVTGLSGGGKASILRVLEDLGYEAIDNPPLTMLEGMVARGERNLAVGIDARTRGFDSGSVMEALARLRAKPELHTELVFAWADEATLLSRYTETRRRHPLAPRRPVAEAIAAEESVTAALRDNADLVIDTSALPLPGLRRLIEHRFGVGDDVETGLVVSLISFAYSHGLPREADLVFDARFLRNPHYDPILRSRTGLDPKVGAYIAADPDYEAFLGKLTGLMELLLPRFVQESKKYVTITIGCTGGRHRSVYLVETLAAWLAARIAADQTTGGPGATWRLHVTHRELTREGQESTYLKDRPGPRRDGVEIDEGTRSSPIQAQEA
jgi:RNase adapter protein RapZ